MNRQEKINLLATEVMKFKFNTGMASEQFLKEYNFNHCFGMVKRG